jgi:formylglycine-generating enzyme required for sulfatase activity
MVMLQTKGMVMVRGGWFAMGSNDFYAEERPVRQIEVGDIWIDEHQVTNAQFRRFVKDSGYTTVAELAPDLPRRHLRVAGRIRSGREIDGQHLAGPPPQRELGARSATHLRREAIRAQRVRPVRRGGNVWEWASSSWRDSPGNGVETVHACCGPTSSALTEEDRRVTKGGSHLCAPSYCHRYRTAARQAHAVRSTTGHLGVRCSRPA